MINDILTGLIVLAIAIPFIYMFFNVMLDVLKKLKIILLTLMGEL